MYKEFDDCSNIIPFGTSFPLTEVASRHHMQYQIYDVNQIKHKNRQAEVLQVVRALYEDSGECPKVTEVIKAAGCNYSTAKPAIESFLGQLEQQKNWRLACDYLSINSVSLSQEASTSATARAGNIRQRSPSLPIKRKLQLMLDAATFALCAQHPKNAYLLTCVCPSKAEASYLAVCRNSRYAALSVIENLGNLLGKDFAFQWLYCWELQSRGALHFHALVNLPPAIDQSVVEDHIRSFWCEASANIGNYYGQDLFADADGASYKDNLSFMANTVSLKPFKINPNSKAAFTYLAKKQKSKIGCKYPRTLSLIGGRPLAPQRWGEVSNSLQAQADALPLIERIPLNSREEVDDLIKQIKKIISANWVMHFQNIGGQLNKIGYRTKFSHQHFFKIKSWLVHWANYLNSLPAPDANEAIDFLVIELHPGGHCCIKRSFSRKNWQNGFRAYKTRRKRGR